MSSFADDHIAANKLFVETVQILQQAAAAKPSKALGLYVQVLGNLDRLVSTYPGSDLAVKIISGQAIGYVSRAGVEQALEKAYQAIKCLGTELPASCIIAEALMTARSVKNASFRAKVLGSIVMAQVKVGQGAAALTIARSIEDPEDFRTRGRALANIAVVQARAGQMSEALTTARSIG